MGHHAKEPIKVNPDDQLTNVSISTKQVKKQIEQIRQLEYKRFRSMIVEARVIYSEVKFIIYIIFWINKHLHNQHNLFLLLILLVYNINRIHISCELHLQLYGVLHENLSLCNLQRLVLGLEGETRLVTDRIVTNSSAAEGCIPIVPSN